MSEEKTFNVKVINADSVLYDKKVVSLSASNKKGRFDVLGNHQPFICLLKRGDIILRLPDKKIETVTIDKGVLRVADNKAVVMVNL